MRKPIFIYDEIFLENIWVSFGVSAEDYVKAVKKYLPKGTKPEPDIEHLKKMSGSFTCFEKPDGDGLGWIWVKGKDHAALTHEVFHAAYTLLDAKGIQLCGASEELFAYYISMIIDKTLKGDSL